MSGEIDLLEIGELSQISFERGHSVKSEIFANENCEEIPARPNNVLLDQTENEGANSGTSLRESVLNILPFLAFEESTKTPSQSEKEAERLSEKTDAMIVEKCDELSTKPDVQIEQSSPEHSEVFAEPNPSIPFGLDQIKEDCVVEKQVADNGTGLRKSILNIIPFLAFEEPPEKLFRTEKEAISQRKSVKMAQENRRRSLQVERSSRLFGSAVVDVRSFSNSIAGSMSGAPRQRRRGRRPRISLAEINGMEASNNPKDREALLQLEIDSLKNQNRELLQQLKEMKTSMAKSSED